MRLRNRSNICLRSSAPQKVRIAQYQPVARLAQRRAGPRPSSSSYCATRIVKPRATVLSDTAPCRSSRINARSRHQTGWFSAPWANACLASQPDQPTNRAHHQQGRQQQPCSDAEPSSCSHKLSPGIAEWGAPQGTCFARSPLSICRRSSFDQKILSAMNQPISRICRVSGSKLS